MLSFWNYRVFFSDPENGDKEHQFWTLASILILVSIPTLPLLLIFTIKQKKTQKVPSQPPNNLQFHDNGESHQGISHPLQFHENDFEENNEDSIQVKSEIFKISSSNPQNQFKRPSDSSNSIGTLPGLVWFYQIPQ